MASKQKFILEATSKGFKKAEGKVKGLSRGLGGLASKAALAAGGFLGAAALVAGMKKATEAAAEQELQEKKLEAQLGHTSQMLLDNARALQQQTMFGDEAIIGVQASIAAFDKNEEHINAATAATLDMAAAMGMDLKGAGDLIAKTLGSSTNALSRYGIEVNGAVGSSERLESLTTNIAKVFGGQAAAQADTLAGKMAQAKNAIGDAAESIGGMLAPAVGNAALMFKDLAEKTQGAIEGLEKIDIKKTMANMISNFDAQVKLVLDVFKVTFDFIPDIAKKAFDKLAPLFWERLKSMWGLVKTVAKTLWEPIPIAANIMKIKIQKAFALMGAKIKEIMHPVIKDVADMFNSMADTWIGAKLGLKPIEIADLVPAEEITAQYDKMIAELMEKGQNTKLASFISDLLTTDDITNAEQYTAALSDIFKNYYDSIVVKKEETKDTLGEGGLTLTPTAEEQDVAAEKLSWYKEQWTEYYDNLGENALRTIEAIGGIMDNFDNMQQSLADAETNRLNKRHKEEMQKAKNSGATADAIKQIETRQAAELTALAERQKEKMRGIRVAGAIMATFESAVNAYNSVAQIPLVGAVMAPIAAAAAIAAGMANVQEIKSAQHGADFITSGEQLLLVGDNPSGREHVQITPLGQKDRQPSGGDTINITVNATGNLLSSEYVEGDLADAITEAIGRKVAPYRDMLLLGIN